MSPLTGPVFVTGFPRSGTSGLAAGLSRLPGFAAHGAEGHFVYLLDDAVTRIRAGQLNGNCILRDAAAQAAFLATMADAVDAAYRADPATASRMWIDKTPDVRQVAALPTIHALFPAAWVFHIYRDPLSVVRSNMATWPAELAGQELGVARRWVQCQATWRDRSCAIPPDRRLEVFQPDLRRDPGGVVDRIAAMMGLAGAQAAPLLDFWTAHRRVNRPIAGQAAADYDAVILDAATADRVLDICAAEMAHWPRLAAAAARPPGPGIAAIAGLHAWEGPYPGAGLPRFAWVAETGAAVRLDPRARPGRLTLTGRSLFDQQITVTAGDAVVARRHCPPGPFTLVCDGITGPDLQIRGDRAARLSPTDARVTGWALYDIACGDA